MDTKQYVSLISKYGDGYDGENWEILACNKEQTLYLVKDTNSLCYVSTSDMVTIMPYGMAVAEGLLVHLAGDSPIPDVQKALETGKIKPSKIIGIHLTNDDIKWLRSEGVSDMVHSVESVD